MAWAIHCTAYRGHHSCRLLWEWCQPEFFQKDGSEAKTMFYSSFYSNSVWVKIWHRVSTKLMRHWIEDSFTEHFSKIALFPTSYEEVKYVVMWLHLDIIFIVSTFSVLSFFFFEKVHYQKMCMSVWYIMITWLLNFLTWGSQCWVYILFWKTDKEVG